jgi:hypothetical protein
MGPAQARTRMLPSPGHYADPVSQTLEVPAPAREILDRLPRWSSAAPAQVRLRDEYKVFPVRPAGCGARP